MPKRKEPQTFPQMIEYGETTKKKSKLYKAQSAEFVDERLTNLIAKTAYELAQIADTEPVELADTERVKERTMLYLRACQETAVIPSITGLAVSMGLSRQAVYDCIWRQSPLSTAKWLELCRDTFSDLLSNAALRNDCNSIVSIFIQKAVYGLRESVEVVARNETPLGQQPDQIAIEKRLNSELYLLSDAYE